MHSGTPASPSRGKTEVPLGHPLDNPLIDRLRHAAEARQATVARFRERPSADDPAVLARQAERRAINKARDQRAAERETARLAAESERATATEAERARAAEDVLRLAAEKVERQAAAKAEQKLARDSRYAARKAKARK